MKEEQKDPLLEFASMCGQYLDMNKIYTELVAIRKRVDATEQRLADIERRCKQAEVAVKIYDYY